jgi:hypothetical protein
MSPNSETKTRRCQRRRVRLALMLISDPEGEKVESPAISFDFSQYSLGVETGASLVPGQLVDIVPNEGPEFAVRGHIVWVGEAGSDQQGKAGLEFLQPLRSPV